VTQHRGELLDSPLAPLVAATIHPSAILRAPGDEERQAERRAFTADIEMAAKAMCHLGQ
jgi:uracil-DNA glycosylase